MSLNLLGAIPDSNKAKEFFAVIGQRYLESNKAEVGDLMDKLMHTKHCLA